MTSTSQRAKTDGDYMLVGGLFLAIALRDEAALLREMAAAGVDANIADPSGRTLLMHTVYFAAQCDGELRRRMVAGIACLLQNNADPNLADACGETASSLALKLRQRDIAKLLLEHGANAVPGIQ